MYMFKTMKVVIFITCLGYYLPVEPHKTDHNSYCKSCLIIAREIEKGLKESPVGSRQAVMEKLLSWSLCDQILTSSPEHVSKDQMKSACIHLLDSHRNQFRAALEKKELRNLDILMCYEVSHACIGVKHQSFQDSKATFKDSEIDALLRKNKENVRVAQPIDPNSPKQERNEL